jgi:hypothetical protein
VVLVADREVPRDALCAAGQKIADDRQKAHLTLMHPPLGHR